MEMTWFGASWNAPINETCKEEKVPLGKKCLKCSDSIIESDRGVIMDYSSKTTTTRVPCHLGCFFKLIGI